MSKEETATVRLPAYVVEGLVEGEAFCNTAWEDKEAHRVLKAAEYVKRGRGHQAIVTAPRRVLSHIADYVWEYAVDSANVLHCYDRFGFSRKVADETVKKLAAEADK